jgi:putative ATP-binding cassette transporter
MWWALKASLLTLVIFVPVVVALLRTTEWGRQFWRITGRYFTSRRSWPAWGLLVANIVLMVIGVRLNVLLSFQGNDMYTALQQATTEFAAHRGAGLSRAEHLFWNSIRLFAVLATIYVLQVQFIYWLSQVFIIHWWRWLNRRVTGDWLRDSAFYRNRFIDATIDNPDQRIQQDVNDFVQTSYALAFGGTAGQSGYAVGSGGVVGSGITVVSFTPILWHLSTAVSWFGIRVPRAMVVSTFGYVLVGSVIAFVVGHPLIRLNFRYQKLTANFRYALVRLRDNAENIAFYRGGAAEGDTLFGRFGAVVAQWWSIVYRTLKFNTWNLVVSQVSVVFPVFFLAPRIFSGAATLGDLTQASSAFGQLQASVSIFRNSYDTFSYYRSTLIRLDGMTLADAEARLLPVIDTVELPDALELDGVDVATPDGAPLVSGLELRLTPGDALVVKGRSGAGKTTLLRSIAQLWPYASGRVRRPLGAQALFLSQLPYLPLGDLRAAVAYPAEPADIDDQRLREALRKVGLPRLVDRLDEDRDWAAILSPGERQRVAFARILLIRPALVFLDEATSAVDEGLEFTLYHLVRTEAPDTILVSVAHRGTVDRHHTQRLDLVGDGPWALRPLPG